MTDDFALLKDRTDLAEYIRQVTGMATQNAGQNCLNLASCPFCGGHDCFRITPSKQRWHCFQLCAPGDNDGDIYDFIQRLNQCDKHQALKTLAEYHGHELTGAKDQPKLSPEEEQQRDGRKRIFTKAALYYHETLMKDHRALGYQHGKRCHADKTLVAFMVGYTDGRLCDHLKAEGFTDEAIVASGLGKPNDGRMQDFFIRDLFIYPHRDRHNQVAGFTIKDQRKKYKYRLPAEYWLEGGTLFFNMSASPGRKFSL